MKMLKVIAVISIFTSFGAFAGQNNTCWKKVECKTEGDGKSEVRNISKEIKAELALLPDWVHLRVTMDVVAGAQIAFNQVQEPWSMKVGAGSTQGDDELHLLMKKSNVKKAMRLCNEEMKTLKQKMPACL